MSGRVVHFEIPFNEGDRARAFYREAFGWDTPQMPEFNYTAAVTGPAGEQGPTEPGYINGGMFKRDGGELAGPIITIDVENIEDALAKVESLGGSAVGGRMSVGDMGFAAYFRDPEGNIMGLWQNA